MLDACEKAARYAAAVGYDGFLDDEPVQALLIRQLEILGEVSARLSRTFVDAHPTWPWREMKALRNYLIHGYDAVDLEQVWATVESDLPGLAAKLRDASVGEMGRF
jgi:uncharacterized protein with HEPN domain